MNWALRVNNIFLKTNKHYEREQYADTDLEGGSCGLFKV
jgi:hypothetical protein